MAISVKNLKFSPPHVFCAPAEGGGLTQGVSHSLELGTGTPGQKL